MENGMRLDALLRAGGVADKRHVRELTAQGRIEINGVRAESSGQRCLESDIITVDGRIIERRDSVTVMLNKPSGYVSVSGESPYPSVLSLLQGEDADIALFPVGRLDADTRGLLLLTNDGSLCERIIRPEAGIKKRYLAGLDRLLPDSAEEILINGAVLPNGTKCLPAQLERVDGRNVIITVCEGKYHEVKRLVRLCGARVSTLERLSIGGLELDVELAPGEYRRLSAEEIEKIFLP